MSDERQEQSMKAKSDERVGADVDDVDSPFDHPAFLPVILWGLAVWFGWDGWINQDPDMLEHVGFNRGGFAVLSSAAVYFTVQAIREMRDEQDPEL